MKSSYLYDNEMVSPDSPEGLGGVSLIVCSTFMSLMLWMYSDSSRHTISLWRGTAYHQQVLLSKQSCNLSVNKLLRIHEYHLMNCKRCSSYLSVEFHSQYSVWIGVIADLSSLLEVTDFELPGGLQTNYSHQAAGEQTLHNAHILSVSCRTHARAHTHTKIII